MIEIEADFNQLDSRGRLLLADLVAHQSTPFADLASQTERILFVDGDEFVEGSLVADADHGWVGLVDWDTQDRLRRFPPDHALARVTP